MKKIYKTEDLAIILRKKFKNKKVGLCHGVFDLLHIGHIKHFEQAKKIVDVLVVSITSDKFVTKGPDRPAFKQELRMQAIAALKDVDYICLSDSKTAIKNLQILRPQFFIKGNDYKDSKKDITGEIRNEIKVLKKFRGKTYFTQGITSSSSKILNEFFNNKSKSQEKFLNKIKKKFTFEYINKLINKFKSKTVLVLGETIIDKYNFTEAIGKSGKEPNLVLRDLKTEQYLGGAVAIALNLSQFCKKINLLTVIGEKGDYLKEIKKKLPKNINLIFIKKVDSPTIVKKRYLDLPSMNKIFGVYDINDDDLNLKQEAELKKKFEKLNRKSDFILISDYGHGFITKKISKIISNSKKFIALNAQINANNIGFHTLKNYKNIDFVIINEKELRHELRNRNGDLKKLIKVFTHNQNIKDLIVTRGSSGAILYNKKNKLFYYCPALSDKILDKVGSGDTMLTQSSLALYMSGSRELCLFLGSVAASETIKNFGNKNQIQKENFLKSIKHQLI